MLKTFLLAAAAWMQFLTTPSGYSFEPSETVAPFATESGSVEIIWQRNGPDTYQKVIKVIPEHPNGAAVVVPYYFPEAMLGGMEGYEQVALMKQLSEHGYICISAEAYHITYARKCDADGMIREDLLDDLDIEDFRRWSRTAELFNRDWPEWSGIGKLVADTRLLIDLLEKDSRVDAGRIGIAGHSLGGKMAFYTACLDSRIRFAICSDFGFLMDSTNWDAPWYWGDKLEALRGAEFSHSELLRHRRGRLDLCIIAGRDDNADTLDAIKKNLPHRIRLHFINHATGHRPTPEALAEAYGWLDGLYL